MAAEYVGAREAILSALSRHVAAERDCRCADVAAVYCIGGLLEVGGKSFRGRRAIQTSMERLRSRPHVAGSPHGLVDVTRELGGTQISFVTADDARVRTSFVATSKVGLDHTGIYVDRFVFDRAQGAWLIAHRVVVVESAARNSSVRPAVSRGKKVSAVPLHRRPPVAGPSVSRPKRAS